MRQLWRLLKYLRPYKPLILGNVLSNILTAVFTVISIPALIPFLQILFDRTPKIQTKPELSYTVEGLVAWSKYSFSQLVLTQGREKALIYVCLLILIRFGYRLPIFQMSEKEIYFPK